MSKLTAGREGDHVIAEKLGWRGFCKYVSAGEFYAEPPGHPNSKVRVPYYTTSVDAALTLVVGEYIEIIRAELKQRLDTLHLRKIDLADEILVLNQDGYIGESTRREIDYAASLGKPVRFWYACPVCGSRYHPLEECDGPCDVDEIQE